MHISCPFDVVVTCQIVMFSWIHLLILFSAHLSLFIVCLVTLLCMPKLEIFYPNIISWYPISQLATWLFFVCFHLFYHSPRISVCSRLEIIGQGVEGLLLWLMSGSNMRKNKGIGRLRFQFIVERCKICIVLVFCDFD